jgi:KUP system potassium uptake protein
MPLEEFKNEIKGWRLRHGGTGVFLTTHHDSVPLVGKNLWLREHARHEQLLLITIVQERVPYVAAEFMARVEELAPGFLRVTASFGFMQHPDVMRVLRDLPQEKLNLDWDRLAFYLPEAIIVAKGGRWRQTIQEIFEFMGRNSLSQAKYFRVQPGEIIHVGVKLEMSCTCVHDCTTRLKACLFGFHRQRVTRSCDALTRTLARWMNRGRVIPHGKNSAITIMCGQ